MTTPDEVRSRGPFVAEYSGIGRLAFTDGHLSQDGLFWTGQAHNGDVFIWFDQDMHTLVDMDSPVASFSGQTASGMRLETRGPLHTVQQQIGSTIRTVMLASETELTSPESRDTTTVCYGLTNFLFSELETRDQQGALPLTLDYLGQAVMAYIHKSPGYVPASRMLHAVGGIQVTAELAIDLTSSEITSGDRDRIAEVACQVLSVARGTKIAWIYRVSLDGTGTPAVRVCSNRVTRDYSGLPLLSDKPEDAEATRVFVETTFPVYLAKSSRYMLDRGSLDTYLEAKSEDQYTEMRALKATVAMEMLAVRHASGTGALQSDQVVDPVVFESLIQELSDNICNVVLRVTSDRKKAKRVAERGRVRALNQRSLDELIRRMWTDIGLSTASEDAQLFSLSRNCLAHTGTFTCSPENQASRRASTIPWTSPLEEYGFLVSLLDRTILRILDYDGPNINWHSLNHHERHMHVSD